MTRLRREISLKKRPKALAQMSGAFSRTAMEDFAQMVWAVWGLQQKVTVEQARGLTTHPREAVVHHLHSEFGIQPWELESLFNLKILNVRDARQQVLPCNHWDVASAFCNLLRQLEEIESGINLNQENVLLELHRIAQRQFSWQSGFVNTADMYRYFFLYGLGGCATFFEGHYGISIENFTKSGFALFAQFANRPLATRPLDYSMLSIDAGTIEAAVAMMTVPQSQARQQLSDLRTKQDTANEPTAYQPSLLRKYPIMAFGSEGERLRAPLPPLIMLRITAGLYYDLLPGGGGLRNEVAKQFEIYCQRYIAAVMPAFDVQPEYSYPRGRGTQQQDSPDILIGYQGRLAIVAECKATKLTFSAQFAGDPALAAPGKYDELAKGVFQIWRFFSHCRRGLTRHTVDDQTYGLLLTVETWMVMSGGLQDHVLRRARTMAAADPDMQPQDQRRVVFAAIQDLERVLSKTDEEGFLNTLAAANEERFLGWMLPNIQTDGDGSVDQGLFPFELGDILPWWREFNERQATRTGI
ncbi:hypothetical protein [Asticcacaulis sp. 201]|uniref:hypothetical protein n=1 Tax=Asticcacaulis sp. 201 TaxID=3028787 RepID=UPI0029165214|nr:hypothetical protein [Asticcacaulis sp. 201]MDV6330047.1 hypothetical protein [Asticcacaulis sp. 201]